jgi:hypothetical protein
VKLEKGNMWSVYDESDLFCITCNSSLLNNGNLVVGRGIAKEAADRLPDLAFMIGYEVQRECGPYGIYGLIIPHYKFYLRIEKIAAFQTKTYWRQPARLDIILRSVAALLKWIEDHPEAKRIDLNFPGIGLGGLSKDEVLPLIQVLPGKVHIWEK